MTDFLIHDGNQVSDKMDQSLTFSSDLDDGELADEERFAMLMSLALDGALSADEASQFDAYLLEHPGFEEWWQEWRQIDEQFAEAPMINPPPDFVAQVEQQLVAVERRRRLWLGFFVGIASVMLWGSVFVGAVGSGIYVLYFQPNWPGELVHLLAYWIAAMASQLASLLSTAGAVWSTPQAKVASFGYLILTAAILFWWMRFLRRSVEVRGFASTG